MSVKKIQWTGKNVKNIRKFLKKASYRFDGNNYDRLWLRTVDGDFYVGIGEIIIRDNNKFYLHRRK